MGWSNAKHLHDVFALVNGAPKLMVDLQWVIRCKNVLWSLVEAFKHNPEGYSTSAFVKQLKAATDALTGLITFCAGTSTVDSKKDWAPVQRHQELLLEQNVHKVVMQVLSCPASLGLKLSELTFKKHKSLHRLCVLCYKLLQAIVMGSPTNARQLSEYIPFMQVPLRSPAPLCLLRPVCSLSRVADLPSFVLCPQFRQRGRELGDSFHGCSFQVIP